MKKIILKNINGTVQIVTPFYKSKLDSESESDFLDRVRVKVNPVLKYSYIEEEEIPDVQSKCLLIDENNHITVDMSLADKVYNSDDLILWAMENYPSLVGTPHEYVLTTFANNPRGYKDIMLTRAAIIDGKLGGTTFTDIANALIARAIKLGADIPPK
jgi:hypothetical protein